jgi:hypothetical protein
MIQTKKAQFVTEYSINTTTKRPMFTGFIRFYAKLWSMSKAEALDSKLLDTVIGVQSFSFGRAQS